MSNPFAKFKPPPIELVNRYSSEQVYKPLATPRHLQPIPVAPHPLAKYLSDLANKHHAAKNTTSRPVQKFRPEDLAHPDFSEIENLSRSAIPLPDGVTDVRQLSIPDEAELSRLAEDGAADSEEYQNLKIVSLSKKKKGHPLTEKEWKFLKDSQWREDFLSKMGIDPKKDLRLRIVYLAFLSVDPGSFRSYASHWKKLRENGFNVDYLGLMSYFAKYPASISTGSLNSWVSAVKLYVRAFGAEGQATLLRLVTDGYAADNPNGLAQERGIIDRGKIQQLVEHPSVKGTPYELGYQLQFATGVRGGQIDAMTYDQFTRYEDRRSHKVICYVYTCTKHKDKQKHRRNAVETHVCDRSYNDLIERLILAAQDTPSGRLIPDWKQNIANEKVKAAAISLDWDEDFVWVNHGIRHGSCLDAADADGDSDEDERKLKGAARTGHANTNVTKDVYLRNEADRKTAIAAKKTIAEVGLALPRQNKSAVVKEVSPAKAPKRKAAKSAVLERDAHTGRAKKPAAGKKNPVAKKAAYSANVVISRLTKRKSVVAKRVSNARGAGRN